MGKLLTRGFHILFVKRSLYSMKIKEQTRKLAAGCSKHCFEVADRTDEVSSKHCFEVADGADEVSSRHCFEVADRTDDVSNIYTVR
ncbi:chlorohydrolase [Streptococcus pneumoniae]|nr:chlorohydrolase [Streptococcus pneumoniae]